MDPATPTTDRLPNAASSGRSVPPRTQQFSLAQLLTLVFACAVFLAFVRLLIRLPDVPLWDLALVIVGAVAVLILSAVLKMRLVGDIAADVIVYAILFALMAHSMLR